MAASAPCSARERSAAKTGFFATCAAARILRKGRDRAQIGGHVERIGGDGKRGERSPRIGALHELHFDEREAAALGGLAQEHDQAPRIGLSRRVDDAQSPRIGQNAADEIELERDRAQIGNASEIAAGCAQARHEARRHGITHRGKDDRDLRRRLGHRLSRRRGDGDDDLRRRLSEAMGNGTGFRGAALGRIKGEDDARAGLQSMACEIRLEPAPNRLKRRKIRESGDRDMRQCSLGTECTCRQAQGEAYANRRRPPAPRHYAPPRTNVDVQERSRLRRNCSIVRLIRSEIGSLASRASFTESARSSSACVANVLSAPCA